MSCEDSKSIGTEQQKPAVSETINESESVREYCARNDITSELQMLIPDTKSKRILCVRKEGEWALPVCYGANVGSAYSQKMIAEAKKLLGFNFDVSVLRWIWNRDREIEVNEMECLVGRAVVRFECQEDPREIPEGWEWVNVDDANIDHPEDEIRRSIRQELLDMQNGTEPKFRVAWGRPGWFRDTSAWMCKILKTHGLEVAGRVVQLKSTTLSTVLQARTHEPAFCNEAAIAEVLCKAATEYVDKPLWIDTERGITITADRGIEMGLFGLERVAKDDWDACFRDLARFQHATSKVMDELEAAILQVYRAEWMEKNLDALLENEELAFLRGVEEFEKVRSGKGDIREDLRDVRKLHWPITLVHNDLMYANIFRRGGKEGSFCFFDWSASFGGYPRGDLNSFNSKTIEAYFAEISLLFNCDFEDCRRAFKISHHLAACFRLLHEIEHVEEQAKVEAHHYLGQKFRFLWYAVRHYKA